MDGFLKKVKQWLHKVSGTPVLGSMAEDLMTLIDLLTDYRAGIYRDLPKGVFIAAAMGLGYALFPVDLILDIIPFAGFLDDAAILMLCWTFSLPGIFCATAAGKPAFRAGASMPSGKAAPPIFWN